MKLHYSYLYFVLLMGAIMESCLDQPQYLETGNWRGVFEMQGSQIPFNFIVEDGNSGTINVFLTNGEEKMLLDSVRFERDSVIIPIQIYDAFLIGKMKENSLYGYFRKNQSANKGIPFQAEHGITNRFELRNQTAFSTIHGKWSVSLVNDKNEQRYTVGLLNQKGSEVTGTLLTTTGDYRFLQGVVDGDSLKLSAFSGSNPTLLQAKIVDSTHLVGQFISPGSKAELIAVKSDTASLPDPYSLTYLKDGYDRLAFAFPDLTGKKVSLSDEKYKGKVVVVTIMGSWCPNCLDEAAFLSPWYQQNKQRGVEIIGLTFERKDDLGFARERLNKFIKKFDIEYDILFAGLGSKSMASEKLPALNAVLSFPTTIFIDRDGRVRKIHTGFSGPATGFYYQEFIKRFNEDINELLAEEKGA